MPELLDATRGPARTSLETRDPTRVAELREEGTLVVDPRRARSRYFDGRFFAARDLIREQAYCLTRQADLSRALGSGVIRGLDVRSVTSDRIAIGAGHGITSAGELVALDRDVELALADLLELPQLDASFGLAAVPKPAPEARTGLYVLALRPIEYVTQPLVRYPTTRDGKRSSAPGEIVEAVAVTLIAQSVERGERDPFRQRAQIASAMFLEGTSKGVFPEALPLAMIALERGAVRWLDLHLVRREYAPGRGAAVGFGTAARALATAHLAQYDQQLQELVARRSMRGGLRFPASAYFEVLPAAGRLPAAAIDASDFTQHFFPPEMTVDLTVVREDELAPMIEESLALPPLDLRGGAEALDFTTLQVLLPLSTAALGKLRLETTTRLARLVSALSARRSARDVLQVLQRPVPMLPPSRAVVESAWREALASAPAPLLWYTRRRTLEQRAPELFHEDSVRPRNATTARSGLLARLRGEGGGP